MSDIRDFTGKNRKFTGTDSIKLPTGTTAERVDAQANLRFNTTLNLAEYYDGTNWKAIDAPPSISSVQVDSQTAGVSNFIPIASGGTSTIVINGNLFDTTNGAITITPQGSGSSVTPLTTTRTSDTQFTITVTRSDFTGAGEPYDITITNGSNLSGSLAGALTANEPPAFSTAADTFVTTSIYAGLSAPFGETTMAATDPESDTPITHTITSGSLPSGVSLSTAGALTGTVASGQEGDYTFTVQAEDSIGNTSTRQFKLTVAVAPGDAEYISTGTYTWTVPTGVTNVSVVCIGAGGAAGIGNSGQAGGGGALAYRNSISVIPGTTGTVVVGGANGRSGNNGIAGSPSSFTYGGITTTAGGGGGGTGNAIDSAGTAGGGGTRSGTYDGGGNGGAGATDPGNFGGPGGGGAGGYSGNGGQGGATPNGAAQNGQSGSGGGGGGGGKGGQSEVGSGGGGGVGFYGQGSNGAGGIGQAQNINVGEGGGGGSGGTAGADGSPSGPGGSGGNYGGGNGGPQVNVGGGNGGQGAVRIVWHPDGATFPSTNVSDV